MDGMAVNAVSNAHGEGYADLHFLIPEPIDRVNFKKGTYYAGKGNFTTPGFVDFKTCRLLPKNLLKVKGGCLAPYAQGAWQTCWAMVPRQKAVRPA